MIDRLLAGAWTVDEFSHAYYDFWLDEVPRGVLSDDDEEFFSDVQEKLDWTAPSGSGSTGSGLRADAADPKPNVPPVPPCGAYISMRA